MKRTLFAIAFALAAFAATAQNNYTYRLDNFYADDDLEVFNYFYRDGRCLAIENLDRSGEFLWTFDSLRYDQNGDMVRLDCYQYMGTAEGWRYVNYCEYTYDDQHRMLTRSNYNNFGGTFELGGVYHFEYDAQGRLAVRWLQFFGIRYDEMTYSYDAQGRLSQTLYKVCDYPSTTLENYERIDYTYEGSNAGPSTVVYTSKDLNSGVMTTYKREYYTYDAQGNCTLFESKTASGLPVEKREYEMESRLLSETLIPHTFEHPEPKLYTNHNTYSRMHRYVANDNDVLTYLCDYLYNYCGINAIAEPTALRLAVYPNPATTSLTIEGLEGDRMLYLYSLDGRLAHMQRLSGGDATVDLTPLACGTYVARVDGQQPRTAKVIVK